MNRRRFLKTGSMLSVSTLAASSLRMRPLESAEGMVITVRGMIDPGEMGVTLPHEHVMSTFGIDATDAPYYDRERMSGHVLPYLKYVHALGCQTLCDCTGAYFGRSPLHLQELSEASGIHILTNTGYYGAAGERYVPSQTFRETAGQIADHWLREWELGIGGTGIRPGFIKTGVNTGTLTPIGARLIEASTRVHRETGLTIAVHTGNNLQAVRQQLQILRGERIHPSAWIWVHAHEAPVEALEEAARQGAWISLDGLDGETFDRHLTLLVELKRRGFLNQLMISHDGNTYRPGTRVPRSYDMLFVLLIPALRDAGFTESDLYRLTVQNPREAFTLRRRLT